MLIQLSEENTMSSNTREIRVLVEGKSLSEAESFIKTAAYGVFVNNCSGSETVGKIKLDSGVVMALYNHDYNRVQANPRGVDAVIVLCSQLDTKSLKDAAQETNSLHYDDSNNLKKMLVITSLSNNVDHDELRKEIEKLKESGELQIEEVDLQKGNGIEGALNNLALEVNPSLSLKSNSTFFHSPISNDKQQQKNSNKYLIM